MDPWMEMNNNSSIGQIDKMAMPISTGQPYTRPEWNPPPKKNHRVTKSISHAKATETVRQEKPAAIEQKAEVSRRKDRTTEKATHVSELEATSVALKREVKHNNGASREQAPKKAEASSRQPPTDSKFDASKTTTHHAEGSAQVKQDRNQMLPVDRKALARQRLEERKKQRKNGATMVGS